MTRPTAGLALLVRSEITQRLQGKARLALIFGLAALLFVTAWACAIAALIAWIIPYFGLAGAGGIVAAGLLVLAVVLVLIAQALARADRRRTTERAAAKQAAILIAANLLLGMKANTLHLRAAGAGLALAAALMIFLRPKGKE